MKKPLYAEYILERENSHYYENDFGFVTYRDEGPSVYLVDMYIIPKYRKKGNCKKFVKYIENIAKEWGKSQIITSISLDGMGVEDSLQAILCCGFKLVNVDESTSMIYFIKGVI